MLKCQRWSQNSGVTMSLLQKTDVYQGSEEKAARKYSDYGFVLALICVLLALVVASVMFPSVPGPYVGP
jgi:hypothetical protein